VVSLHDLKTKNTARSSEKGRLHINSKSLGRIPTNERHNDISQEHTPKKNSERKMNISRNLPASRLFFEDNKKADQERTQC